MNPFFKATCAVVAAMFVTAAGATPVLDQNSGVGTGGFCFMISYCGQSFKETSGDIAGAGVYIAPNFGGSTASTLTISIYSSYSQTGGTPSGLVASGSVSGVTSSSGWVDVFWTPVALAANTTYYMVVSDPALAAAYTATSYANGTALSSGYAYSGYDLAFRTYSDNVTAAVPEPMSLGLLGIGLLGLGMSRRRKNT